MCGMYLLYLFVKVISALPSLFRLRQTCSFYVIEYSALLKECIHQLKNAAAVKPLTLETGLCRSAQLLADDQAYTGATEHTGSDDSNLSARISRYGTWGTRCGENCAYGSITAREIVV